MRAAAQSKPNILVIFGDDIGQTNISVYGRGVVGYDTPHIDRIAAEGMMFTDYYADNSCTAGRSSFITGQTPLRTGLSKVGRLPKLFNLRMDPYERADIVSDQYYDFQTKNIYLNEVAIAKVDAFLQTFVTYPPSQQPASFSVDQIRKRVDEKIDESFKARGLK